MTETPEQRIARLEAELASAKVDALQKQLADAQAHSGHPGSGPIVVTPDDTEAFRREAAILERMHRDDAKREREFRSLPTATTRLAPVPRPVPFAYRAVAFNFGWWAIFALVMLGVAPIALYMFVPVAALIAVPLGLGAVLYWKLSRAHIRHALLRWGDVARVDNAELLSMGTYYSGTTVQNMRMSQAKNWKVARKIYSGPVYKTKIDYSLNGTPASMTLLGLPYVGGVILADTRRPSRALCVSSFPYDLEPDASGNWPGKVATSTKVGAVIMAVLTAGWALGMVALYLGFR